MTLSSSSSLSSCLSIVTHWPHSMREELKPALLLVSLSVIFLDLFHITSDHRASWWLKNHYPLGNEFFSYCDCLFQYGHQKMFSY